MKKQSIVDSLRKKRFQAKQLHPNAMVVYWEAARKAVEQAYDEGMNSYANLVGDVFGKDKLK